ncbi:MAG: glutamine-hydrolyzing carbamoyl-phosphate synthase small subunit [Actinomycetota bacterium]|nr:glutamine-hydrolyzing carbamoyl-phosphate synthase small subunit [Actinomycetota bacterium]
MSETPGLLVLEDGTSFEGVGFGARATVTGEICFNTSMTGYQEVLTDPSYHGQIVTMTTPHIGNTGTNGYDDQSRRPWVAGFVTRAGVESPSSWRAQESLDGYLRGHAIPALSEVDTRRLTRHVRTKGAMKSALSTEDHSVDELVDLARAWPGLVGRDLAREVTTQTAYGWGADTLAERARGGYAAGSEHAISSRSLLEAGGSDPVRIAALDFGIKHNLLDLLASVGCEVTVLPAYTGAAEVLAGAYNGVFLSNGPGDPAPLTYAIETVSSLLGRLPVFGICLGHQILGLAVGAETYKLPFGHRGGNHPVRRLGHDHVEITCQNHGFAVEAHSVTKTPASVTHVNLNDGTVEGLAIPGVAYSVQYHPESGPGPHDSRYLFTQFRKLIAEFEPSDLQVAEVMKG